MSSGGVGFEYDKQLAVGQELNIEFNPWLEGKEYTIRAKGVVTFNMVMKGSTGFSHGLKFPFIPRDQFDRLAEVLKALEQR